MTGGLLELVAKGSQDIFLTGNPSVTFFRSVYKKHTNFSMESVQQTLVGNYDFGETLYCNISRSGDLLFGIVLEFDIPKMTGLATSKTQNWIDSIGHYIIEEVYIEVGGQIIDRQYGEWMDIWNELTMSSEHLDGYSTMIGKNKSGISDARTLIVPLQFWFCKNIGLALPLIALQYHEVKIFIKIANFDKLWRKSVKRYNVSRSTSGLITLNINEYSTDTDDFSSIDTAGERYDNMSIIWENDEEENIIQSVDVGADPDKLQLKTGTYTAKTKENMYIILNKPDKTYSLTDVRMYCDYIYLDTAERKYFAQTEHSYLIEQTQYNGVNDYQKDTKSIKIPLEFNHPCKELIWVNKLNIVESMNQHNNFSDKVSVETDTSDNSLVDALLYLNGKERFNKRKADYFRLLVPLQRHTRVPSSYIYVYSFALNPEQNQPSGTCNFSRLDNSELVVTMKDGLLTSKIKVYATNYNILRIINGMGGLAYSN